MHKTIQSPSGQAAWNAFVQQSLASPYSRGQNAVLGVLGEQDLAIAREMGKTAESRVVHVEDRLLIGKKAKRHQSDGNALSAAEWIALPGKFARPTMRLWDTKRQTLILIYDSEDARHIKIAVDVNRFRLGAGEKANRAATVFKVKAADIQSGINNGLYEKK
ncbi:hypothetical protein D8B25_07685 [Verminephrobacter aporrectodeae subsp. tuberculatae]|nr:hypothetical protein [Verminephrobacter aporrectodeae subsp. tuberculatae]MCW8202748.1 hypothetical protein [Verminephrobacter aporrectodeae subsp. tuberculatae]